MLKSLIINNNLVLIMQKYKLVDIKDIKFKNKRINIILDNDKILSYKYNENIKKILITDNKEFNKGASGLYIIYKLD